MSWPQANFVSGITVFKLKFAKYLSEKFILSQKFKKKRRLKFLYSGLEEIWGK